MGSDHSIQQGLFPCMTGCLLFTIELFKSTFRFALTLGLPVWFKICPYSYCELFIETHGFWNNRPIFKSEKTIPFPVSSTGFFDRPSHFHPALDVCAMWFAGHYGHEVCSGWNPPGRVSGSRIPRLSSPWMEERVLCIAIPDNAVPNSPQTRRRG